MVAAADRRGAQEAVPSDAPPQPAPVAFEAAMQFGGTVFGVPVASMKLVLADGRVLTFDLPLPAPPPPVSDGRRLSAAEAAVLEVVEGMPVGAVWSVAEILDKAGYSVTTAIRRYIRSLRHLLVEHTQGWERANIGEC